VPTIEIAITANLDLEAALFSEATLPRRFRRRLIPVQPASTVCPFESQNGRTSDSIGPTGHRESGRR